MAVATTKDRTNEAKGVRKEEEQEEAWKGTRDIRLMYCITQGVLGDLPSYRNW